jgi:hypothetical protein
MSFPNVKSTSPPRSSKIWRPRALGTLQADPSQPTTSIANLPYEMQVAIFEAAITPQIFFVEIDDSGLVVLPPTQNGMARACRLSREIYTANKEPRMFGGRRYWVNSEQDMFYLHKDRVPRYDMDYQPGAHFDGIRDIMHIIAVDLEYLDQHPRREALVRTLTVFRAMKEMCVLVPKGPLRSPTPAWTADNMALERMPDKQVVAAPRQDQELVWAVKYQLKRTCARILSEDNHWLDRATPKVTFYTAYIHDPLESPSRGKGEGVW